jgi:hypothetical protein
LIGSIFPSNIIHSEDFVNKVRNVDLTDKKMISFDIISLFTKVPVTRCLNWIEKFLIDNENVLNLPIPANIFVELLKNCLSFNFFKFENNFYKQKEGLSMGNPLSPVLSILFMEFLEAKNLNNINEIILWYRYVDDVFAIIKGNCDIQIILNKINKWDENIKFTYEIETNDKLPFLDILIMRHMNNLKFKVFRKPTNSNIFINWMSGHSYKVKGSALISSFLRALRICSPEYIEEENNNILKIYKKLGYPYDF